MKRIEIYFNGEAGGYHTLMICEGHSRVKHEFTSQVPNEMYAEASRLIESDAKFEKSVRCIDPSMKTIRSGDMTLSARNLKFFATNSGKAPAREPVTAE